MGFRSHIISEEKAKGARKVLRWIKDSAPRKKEREEASSLLKILEGVRGGSKQIILTRGQEEMLTFILEEFPVVEPTQLSLFNPQEELLMSGLPVRSGSTKLVRPDRNLPKPHSELVKPRLKEGLSEEERQARRSIGLSSVPGKTPLDTTGVLISKRITDIQESTAAKEREFGKRETEGE